MWSGGQSRGHALHNITKYYFNVWMLSCSSTTITSMNIIISTKMAELQAQLKGSQENTGHTTILTYISQQTASASVQGEKRPSQTGEEKNDPGAFKHRKTGIDPS